MANFPGDPTGKWFAVSYQHNALNAFVEAYELQQLSFRIGQLALKSVPTISPEANEQRKQILLIAQKLIASERDIKMDRVVRLWTDFRTMEPVDG